MVVRQIFEELQITPESIDLGVVLLQDEISNSTKAKLSENLHQVGFALIDGRKSRMIEQIKHLVIDNIHNDGTESDFKWSELISDQLNYDYKYLSNLFSSVEGTTLAHYIINQKIERVKELMLYDELTLTQIADQLGYSSVPHLSGQFKKVTGMNPSQFKTLFEKNRKGLDSL